jgi:hypothetical protein
MTWKTRPPLSPRGAVDEKLHVEDKTLAVQVRNAHMKPLSDDWMVELRLLSNEGDTLAVYLTPQQARRIADILHDAADYAENN